MKINIGDCFSIPIDKDKIGLCQIIYSDQGTIYINIFEGIIERSIIKDNHIIKTLDTTIILCGESLDARIYHKYWKFIGNFPIKKEFNPEKKIFKEEKLLGYILVDYFGKKVRNISKKESYKYSFHKTIAPIRFENALKAFHGFIEWDNKFDELLCKVVR